jgi:heme-degrading monooxygenase HmoA
MHARFVRYAFTGDAVELARRAEAGLLPIFQSQPGFKAYTIFESDGEIFSFSAWESADAAEAANKAAAQWVSENLADKVQLKESRIGEIYVGTALGVSQLAGVSA